MRERPRSTHFPYTTLFRSSDRAAVEIQKYEKAGHERRLPSTVGTNESDHLARCDVEVDAAEDFLAAAKGTERLAQLAHVDARDRKSTRLNSSHGYISYAAF